MEEEHTTTKLQGGEQNENNAVTDTTKKDKECRLASYQVLLELRDAGFVWSVGVCNYGVTPLQEIAELVGGDNLANLPAINQLELSPFNTHSDVVQYCDRNGIAVGCVAKGVCVCAEIRCNRAK